MKFSRVLFGIITLAVLLLGIFALPRFRITVGDRELQWPALDFSTIAPGSPWGNFRKGTGLYPANQFHFQAVFAPEQTEVRVQIFQEDVELIRRRMQASNLYDVELTTQVSEDDYQIILTFPDYYQEVDMQRLALLLVQPGAITILEHDFAAPEGSTPHPLLSQFYSGYVAKDSELVQVGDIAAITIETRSVLNGSVWRIRFAEAVRNDLNLAISSAGYATSASPMPIVVAIDNNPAFVLVYTGQELDMLARPFDAQTDFTELKIMSTYLLGSVGVRTAYTLNATSQQDAIYGLEGKAATGLAIIASAAVLGLLMLRRFGRRGAVAFGLALAAYVLLAVSVFKLLAVSLSIGFLVAFLAIYALGVLVIFDLISTEEALVKGALVKYRNLGGMLVFIAGVLYVTNIGFGAYQDMLGVLAVAGMVLFICCVLFFPQIIAFIHNQDD